MKRLFRHQRAGFTLLEILLVVAAIAILAGIVIFAVNPGEQLAKMRNGQRTADLNQIVNAVYAYSIDSNGTIPTDIEDFGEDCLTGDENAEICKTGETSNCTIDLSVLTENQKYLVEIPEDPQGYLTDTNGTGYRIMKNENNRIIACAPKAELGATLEVIK